MSSVINCDIIRVSFFPAPLGEELLERLKSTFYDDPKNVLALNACTITDPLEVCTSRYRTQQTQHVFTYRVNKLELSNVNLMQVI